MSVAVTDRIEKNVVLKAPRTRVWNALATPAEFVLLDVQLEHPDVRVPVVRVGCASDHRTSRSGEHRHRESRRQSHHAT